MQVSSTFLLYYIIDLNGFNHLSYSWTKWKDWDASYKVSAKMVDAVNVVNVVWLLNLKSYSPW